MSRNSEISIQIYLRNNSSSNATVPAPNANDMGKADIFLGSYKLTPDFEFTGGSKEAWYSITGGTGDVNLQIAYTPSTVSLYWTV